jgi:hypothetical protein
MSEQMISKPGERRVAVPRARGTDEGLPPESETFSFVDVERGDPEGAEVEAAVASWDGFL